MRNTGSGDGSRLIAEFATSEGNNSVVNVSDDGGLTYQAVAQAAGSSGDAYKIAAEIDAGDWFGAKDRLLLNTYFKHLDTGFSANSVTSEQGSEKSGIGASYKFSPASSLLGRYERQTQLTRRQREYARHLAVEHARATTGVSPPRSRIGRATPVMQRTAALRMNYRWSPRLSTTFEHQQTLSGLENDQSTAGRRLSGNATS